MNLQEDAEAARRYYADWDGFPRCDLDDTVQSLRDNPFSPLRACGAFSTWASAVDLLGSTEIECLRDVLGRVSASMEVAYAEATASWDSTTSPPLKFPANVCGDQIEGPCAAYSETLRLTGIGPPSTQREEFAALAIWAMGRFMRDAPSDLIQAEENLREADRLLGIARYFDGLFQRAEQERVLRESQASHAGRGKGAKLREQVERVLREAGNPVGQRAVETLHKRLGGEYSTAESRFKSFQKRVAKAAKKGGGDTQ